jgi:hypothetical protein
VTLLRRGGRVARPRARRSRSERRKGISALDAVATGVRQGVLVFALLVPAAVAQTSVSATTVTTVPYR